MRLIILELLLMVLNKAPLAMVNQSLLNWFQGNTLISIKGFASSAFDFDLKFASVMKLETQVKEEGIRANVIIVSSDEDAV
jgi:hypothetical protein